jgi:hypothetical protein
MNFETMKMLLSEVRPKRITNDYDYTRACVDMEEINLLLRKQVFRIVEKDGLQLYCVHLFYSSREFYSHLSSNPKLLTKIKNLFNKKIYRYQEYLEEYYTSIHGKERTDKVFRAWF